MVIMLVNALSLARVEVMVASTVATQGKHHNILNPFASIYLHPSHMKADCPEPAKGFTGTCHHCNQEGHRAAECPEKPAEVCMNCKEEGWNVPVLARIFGRLT